MCQFLKICPGLRGGVMLELTDTLLYEQFREGFAGVSVVTSNMS